MDISKVFVLIQGLALKQKEALKSCQEQIKTTDLYLIEKSQKLR
jgi:hypothetical protein